MESKPAPKSNIVVEYDDMGRKIWKVMDASASESNNIKPPSPPSKSTGITRVDENGKVTHFKRDTLKKRDYKVDHIRKLDGKEFTVAKDAGVDSVTPFHCKK